MGLPVPEDQLYYPVGIQTLDPGTASPRLAVHSTNFDQRFQSGQVSLFAADEMIDGVLERLGVEAGANPCAARERPLFLAGFGPEVLGRETLLDRVRLPGIGGRLLAHPVRGGAPDESRIFAIDRLDGALVYVARRGDTLDCGGDREDVVPNTDCSEAHLSVTQAEDPYTLARGFGPRGPFIAVGHLFGYIQDLQSFGVVTFLDEEAVVARSRAGMGSPFMYGLQLGGARGISGVAATSSAVRPRDATLVLGGPSDPPMELAAVDFRRAGDAADAGGGRVPVVSASLRFDRVANASGGRGLVVTPDGRRAIVSLRFEDEDGVSFNAAVAVVDLTADELAAFPAVEVGEELGPPYLRPAGPDGALLAYLGDLRTDKVWVVDVTRDLPRVVGELVGRAPRVLEDGTVIDARVFDGPTGFAFARRAGRTYAFVTNFANSTLTVLDVTDPNPRGQCILARLGRDVDANGESEAERQR